jgi:2',3'-cyclic-nucleotide 2'-phosphodiesterase (5'-nucleotidase family)
MKPALMFLAAAILLPISPARSESPEVLVVGSSDVQGDLYPCDCPDTPSGGLAQRVTTAADLHGAGSSAVWLDAGNGLFDSAGAVPTELMPNRRLRAMTLVDAYALGGLDAHNVGPWDLAEGVEYLHRLALRSGIAFVSSNLWWSEEQEPTGLHFSGDVMLQLTDDAGHTMRLGILGVLPGNLSGYGWYTSDPIRAAKARAKALRKQGADRLVCLAALPADEALRLAKKVKGLDLVLQSGGGTMPRDGFHVRSALVVRSAKRGRSLSATRLTAAGHDHRDVAVEADTEADPRLQGLLEQLELRLQLPFEPPEGESAAGSGPGAPPLPPAAVPPEAPPEGLETEVLDPHRE